MNRLSTKVAELKAINSVCVLVSLDSEVVVGVVGREAARKYHEAVQGNAIMAWDLVTLSSPKLFLGQLQGCKVLELL